MSLATLDPSKLAMHTRRKRVNAIALTLSLAAMAFGLVWLIWILVETVRLGFAGLSLAVFTEMTPPPQTETGGLANAIFGSSVMVGLATCVGTPVGIMAGVYLAEYGQRTWLGRTTQFINDILLSAPSIVIGLFIYAVIVTRFKILLGLCRHPCAGLDRHPRRHPHHRDDVEPDSECAARSRVRFGHAEVESDFVGHAQISASRCGHRCLARPGAHCR